MIFIVEKIRIFGTIKKKYQQKPDKIIEYFKKNNGDLNFVIFRIKFRIEFVEILFE